MRRLWLAIGTETLPAHSLEPKLAHFAWKYRISDLL
jgi:hypothetical protein